MASTLPLFPRRNFISTASPQPNTLQIISRAAQQADALDLSEEDRWTDHSEQSHNSEPVPDLRADFKERISALQTQVGSLSFTVLEDLGPANELLVTVLSLKDEIELHHEPIKRPLKQAHALACKAEHEDLDPVVALEKQLKQGIAALDLKLRQLETETARAKEQAAAEAGSAMQQQMIEAARLSGASDEVLASLGAMHVLVPIAAPESLGRPKGYSTRDQFEVEVTDLLLLAKAVLAGSIQKEVLQANVKLLAAMAKASSGDLQIPGVRITKKVNISGRRMR